MFKIFSLAMLVIVTMAFPPFAAFSVPILIIVADKYARNRREDRVRNDQALAIIAERDRRKMLRSL